jgi:hypothetical protein
MSDEFLKKLGLQDELALFEKTGVTGVFGYMVNIKKLKTRPTRTIEIETDPMYGPVVIDMSDGDIPAENTNEVPVAILKWDDFVSLCKTALASK